jgi:hypothetical protein
MITRMSLAVLARMAYRWVERVLERHHAASMNAAAPAHVAYKALFMAATVLKMRAALPLKTWHTHINQARHITSSVHQL